MRRSVCISFFIFIFLSLVALPLPPPPFLFANQINLSMERFGEGYKIVYDFYSCWRTRIKREKEGWDIFGDERTCEDEEVKR
ncbi:hypothetical protein IE53DRAFT_168778 [Violaceomyces palustris]|uniref:Uncharacterized protein n=1 Tax=Violaceomyces palustris TaxID=1673888 RepID=A0ACD0NT16_9BASI|nr:hypothetical protein IE53DRAFT_168778 [Violaceomyces palustris]